MKAFLVNGVQVGGFSQYEQLSDRWLCDGQIEYQFSLVPADCEIVDYVAPPIPIEKETVEHNLNEFAKQRDFDGIGEASALLTSTNIKWKNEAQTYVRLWDETWQAFYDNKPLPQLTWGDNNA